MGRKKDNMRDPVTPHWGSLWVGSDQGCFRDFLSSPTSLSDSHGIFEHWQRWSLWSGLVSLLIGFGIFLFFKASLATLKNTTICSTTALISQTSEVNSSRWLWWFFCFVFGIISLPRRSLFRLGDWKYLWPTKDRDKKGFSGLLLCLFTSHLQNPVHPDGAVLHLESLYEAEIWKRPNQTGECCFQFFYKSMTYVRPRKYRCYNEAQGKNRKRAFLARSFALLNKTALSDKRVFIQPETLTDTVRYLEPSKQTLSLSLCLITCLLQGPWIDSAAVKNSLWMKSSHAHTFARLRAQCVVKSAEFNIENTWATSKSPFNVLYTP